jgi:hypothetical protein
MSSDLDYSVLCEYAFLAKQIVHTESKMQNILCDKSEETKNKELWHLTFETFYCETVYVKSALLYFFY